MVWDATAPHAAAPGGTLRVRPLLVLAIAYAASVLGDEFALIALTVRVHQSTGASAAVAALLGAGVLPLLLFSPVAGHLVDRFDNARLVAVTTAIQAVIAAAMVFSGPVLVIALVAVLNLGVAITGPAVLALVPVACGEAGATRGYSLLEGVKAGAGVAGIGAGGALTGLLGTNPLLLLDAASFLLLAAVFAVSPLRRRGAEDDGPVPMWTAWRRGIHTVLDDRVTMGALVALAIAVVCVTAVNTLWIFYTIDVAGIGRTGYGVTAAAWSLGILAAVAVIPKLLPEPAMPRTLALATIGLGTALAAATFVRSLAGLVVVTVLCGAGNGVQNVAIRVIVRRRTPERDHGRAFAFMSAWLGSANLLGLLLGGVLGAVIGVVATLRGAGGLTVVAGLAAFVIFYSRTVRTEGR